MIITQVVVNKYPDQPGCNAQMIPFAALGSKMHEAAGEWR